MRTVADLSRATAAGERVEFLFFWGHQPGESVGKGCLSHWIVVEGNTHKFRQHADMGAFLRGTGDRVLVEASPLDRVWGIGLREDDPRAKDPDQWRGLNLLGFALGDVRDVLAGATA